MKNEVQRAIAADEDALKRLCGNYIDNVKAYTQREKVKNKFTGQYEEPDERLMRSIEEKIDIPDSRKDDFRREIMNYIGALSIDGKTFDYKTNERLYKALELKLFEDQKDTIKLTSLVSQGRRRGHAGQDRRGQEPPDPRLRLRRRKRDRRAELRGQHFCPRRREEDNSSGECTVASAEWQQSPAGSSTQPLALARHGHENRPRRVAVQTDRARQDPREPAEVRHPRRDDRPQGEAISSASRCRSSMCRTSATARTAAAASARAKAKSASRSAAGEPTAKRPGPGRQRSRRSTCWKSMSRSKNWPRSWATNCELPRIEPKGKANIAAGQGPLHQHPPRRARVAAALQADLRARRCGGRSREGTYDPPTRASCPIKDDRRYRSWENVPEPEANAVIIYMMDVSGSMTDEQKEIVRTEAFWIDTWLTQPVRRRRAALHHSRRGGQGSRRGHVLSHARKRRHADQLGLQGLPGADREAVSTRPSGTSTASSSPTATTGAKTTSRPWRCCARRLLPDVQPVLLRPGRKPLRQRRVLSASLRRRLRRASTKSWCCPRSKTKKRFTSRSRQFLGKGKVDIVSGHGQCIAN